MDSPPIDEAYLWEKLQRCLGQYLGQGVMLTAITINSPHCRCSRTLGSSNQLIDMQIGFYVEEVNMLENGIQN